LDDLLIRSDEHILDICINRPDKRNSLTPEMLHLLAETLDEVGSRDETQILVLRGTGDRYFSAGYDISRIPRPGTPEAEAFALRKPLDLAVEAVERFPYPTIAMLGGSVIGGGCELAFACDFRYAASGIEMCMPPSRLGIVYSVEGLERIGSVIGLSNLKKMIFTARSFATAELSAFGAVDEVLAPALLERRVMEVASAMGQLAPLALKGHKWILGRFGRQQLGEEDLREARQWILRSYRSEDAREAQAAFMEKRPPRFCGR